MDNELFSSDTDASDSEYDNIEEPETQFWEKINVNVYDLQLDLQKSAFLIDLLEDLYKFELENNRIIIYEKKNNGIEEIIERDKIIYFLHIKLVNLFKEAGFNYYHKNGKNIYNSLNYFKEVDTIHKAIDNMKIYLKYYKQESEEESEEVGNTKPLMKEKKTKKLQNKKINDNLDILRPTVL